MRRTCGMDGVCLMDRIHVVSLHKFFYEAKRSTVLLERSEFD